MKTITKETIQALRDELAHAHLDAARAQHEWDTALFAKANMQAPEMVPPAPFYHVHLDLITTDAALESERTSLEGVIAGLRETAAMHRARTTALAPQEEEQVAAAANSNAELTDDKVEVIERHLAAWHNGSNTQVTRHSIAQGFVSWTWDEREDTLTQLQDADVERLGADLAYSVAQDHDMRGLVDAHDCAAYLTAHASPLIDALTERMSE